MSSSEGDDKVDDDDDDLEVVAVTAPPGRRHPDATAGRRHGFNFCRYCIMKITDDKHWGRLG